MRTAEAKKTFDTNCTDPSAARSDCAAKPKDAKFKRLPTMNMTTPSFHCQKCLKMDVHTQFRFTNTVV